MKQKDDCKFISSNWAQYDRPAQDYLTLQVSYYLTID
jgi:hypothetical protein